MSSNDGVIRIFPAIPSTWPDVSFADLRAEGAFLVSAVRSRGATQFVRVTSLAGEPAHIHPGMPGDVRITGSRQFMSKTGPSGVIEIDVRKGETVTLTSTGTATMPKISVSPVARLGDFKPWGQEKSPVSGA